MMAPAAASVLDWSALVDLLWASVVGGVGVTATFSLTLLGVTRAADMRRAGRVGAAGAYVALAVVCGVVVVGAVVFGVVVMTSKD